ncbi:MAG: DNA repair protein RadC [Gammaproteobacteria bacterium]|jgi:DNA repair protein RadC|nr:DNA repair protein RadC [Gammaproteobacteria bacterium]
MGIRQWPVGERPRERLHQAGPEALSDGELLALVLGSGWAGGDALQLGRRLLTRFGSLRELLRASGRQLEALPGMGPAKASRLQAALALGRRVLAEPLLGGQALDSPAVVRQFLRGRMLARRREVFACLYLDTRHRLIFFEELFRGTLDGAAVYPREVVRRALELGAAALILAHNHPSGVAEPSQADRALTRRLVEALSLVDIRILDHFVVGEEEVASFCERGLL